MSMVDITKGYVLRETVEKYFKQVHYELCEIIDHQRVTGKPSNRKLHKLLTELETVANINGGSK